MRVDHARSAFVKKARPGMSPDALSSTQIVQTAPGEDTKTPSAFDAKKRSRHNFEFGPEFASHLVSSGGWDNTHL